MARVSDKPTLAAVDQIVGVYDGTIGPVPRATLATLLAGSGAVADAISALPDAGDLSALQAADSALNVRIDGLEGSTTYASLLFESWSELSVTTGAGDGQRAEVSDGDLGSHDAASGTGYDGANIDNAGAYRWDGAWSRWIRVGDTGLAGKADLEHAHTPTEVGLGDVDNTSDAAKPLSDLALSAFGGAVALAAKPDLTHFDFIADFAAGAYAAKSSGRMVPKTYAGQFEQPRLSEPLTGAGLTVPDSASDTNKCYIGLNDRNFENVLSVNDLTATIVEIADLPADVAAYFEGLDMGIERVFRLVNSTGSTETLQAYNGTIADGDRTASAYVYAVAGTVKVSTGGSPHSDAAALGSGARISATTASGGGFSVRCNASSEAYFAGAMVEEGGAVSTYEDAYQIRNRVEPRGVVVGGAGVILCQVLWPSDPGTVDSVEIFSLSDSSNGGTVLRCTMNWTSGGSIVFTADDGTTSGNVNRSTTFSAEVPTLIAAQYDASGNIALSVNGCEVDESASGVDLSVLNRLRIGGGHSVLFDYSSKFLGGAIQMFAYKEGAA